METLPLVLLAPVLIAVGYFDLRYMRIPNAVVFVAIALFIVTSPMVDWPELALRMIAASVVFLIGFALYASGIWGGGDVKMLAALMLFVPSETYTLFALGFSAAMLFGIGTILVLRAIPFLSGSSWISLQQCGTFPMGISIAMAGLQHPLLMSATS